MKCPVTILAVTCGAEIEPQQGEAVGNGDGRLWIVCASCAARGVRIADVERSEPALTL